MQGPDGSWVDVKPIEGTIVVNAADLLMRWSNDLIKSTMHRVVEPRNLQGDDEASDGAGVHTDDKLHPARYSIAYFCNPTFDRMIETIPGTVKEGEVKKYEAVNSGDYLIKRLEATY